MGAPAIAYLVSSDGSAPKAGAGQDGDAIPDDYLLVSVVDASATAAPAAHAPDEGADSCLLVRVETDPNVAFGTVTAFDTELVTVPVAPAAAASIVYFELSGVEPHAQRAIDRLAALCGWLVDTQPPSTATTPVVVAGRNTAGVVAALLRGHRTATGARNYDELLAAHREQMEVLSDLRLEHNELVLRAADLSRECDALRERAASATRANDALRENETSAQGELEALQATRLFRYTAGLRRIYTRARALGRRQR
jgi:hypothetical protein